MSFTRAIQTTAGGLLLLMSIATVATASTATQPTTLPSAADLSDPGERARSGPGGISVSISPGVAPTTAPTTAINQPATQPAAALTSTGEAADVNQQELHRNGTPAASKIPAANLPQASTLDLPRVGIALAAVLGLIFILRWCSRKILAIPSTKGSANLMQVVSRTTLAPRQQLLLVRVGSRLMVVGDSAGTLSSLGQITEPDEVASLLGQTRATPAPRAETFSGLFRKLTQRWKPVAADAPWDEADLADPTVNGTKFERDQLLSRLSASDEAHEDGADLSDVLDRQDMNPDIGLDETAARQAVEAARQDIHSLRAKLRQVTQRLAEPDGSKPDGLNGNSKPPPAEPSSDSK